MSSKPFFKTLITSLILAFLGAAVSFLTAFSIVIILFSIQYSLLNIAITQDVYLEQFNIILPVIKIYEQYGHQTIIIPISLVVGTISIISFLINLKIINPNFSLKYIKNNKISQIKIVTFFVITSVFISIVSYLFSNISLFLSSFVSIFILLFFWHQQGIWGDFKNFTLKGKSSFQKLKLFLLPSLVYSVWIYIIGQIGRYLLNHNPYFLTYETTWINQVTTVFIFLNICFLTKAIELPLCYLIADIKYSFQKSLPKLIAPIIITIIAVIFIFKTDNFIKQFGFDKNLIEETNVNQTLESNKTIIILTQDKPTSIAVDYAPVLTTSSVKIGSIFSNNISDNVYNYLKDPSLIQKNGNMVNNTVSCHEDNIQKMQNYGTKLQDIDYKSSLSQPYFAYLSQCYKQNWQLDEFYQTQFLALEKTNSVLMGATLTSSSSLLAYKNQKLLDLINQIEIDGNKYYIGAESREQINKINKHYLDQSDQFIGSIDGQISIDGYTSKDIKIGLLADNKSFGVPIRGSKFKLVASLSPDQFGNFKFYNILKGKYNLGILLNDQISSQTNIAINNENVNPIEISDTNKNIRLGNIIIKID